MSRAKDADFSDVSGSDLITKSDPQVTTFFASLDRMLSGVEAMAKSYKPPLGGERYLTDKEVSQRLKVSRRTLQDYRNEGKIPYCYIGGKLLYRESDIERMLAESYREAYR